jgi:hypothetical protein
MLVGVTHPSHAATFPTQPRPALPPWTAPVALGGLFAAAGGWLWLVRTVALGELIRPVSPDLFAAAVFVGVLVGLLLVVRIGTSQAHAATSLPRRRWDAIAGALVLPLLMASACLRLGVQAAAFTGVAPGPPVMIGFTVTGTGVSHGSHYLRVRLDDAGREFSVPVRTATWTEAQAGDVITLPVQTGRFGIQRAMVADQAKLASPPRR